MPIPLLKPRERRTQQMKQNDFVREIDENGKERIVVSNRSGKKLDIIPRLICVLFAIIIWLYCVNINESDVVATYTVKIETVGSFAEGVSIYDDRNVTEVKITVQGTNRDINKYSASDYKAYVDVSDISRYGWSTLKLNIQLPGGAQSSLSLLNADIDTVEIYADVSATKEIPVSYDETDFNRKDLYYYDIKHTEKMSITGPKTVLDTIYGASIVLKGENSDTSTSKTGPGIKFLGQSLSATDVIVSDLVSYDPGSVNLNISVSTTKPLALKGVGESADLVYSFDIPTVNVIGDPELLKHLSECIVNIPYTEGTNQMVLSSDMLSLPAGVLLQSEDIVVTVTVSKLPNAVV